MIYLDRPLKSYYQAPGASAGPTQGPQTRPSSWASSPVSCRSPSPAAVASGSPIFPRVENPPLIYNHPSSSSLFLRTPRKACLCPAPRQAKIKKKKTWSLEDINETKDRGSGAYFRFNSKRVLFLLRIFIPKWRILGCWCCVVIVKSCNKTN